MLNTTVREGRDFNPGDFVGESVAFMPIELRPEVVCKKGTPDEYKRAAFLADVLVLSGESAGNLYAKSLVFDTAIVAQLTSAHGSDDSVVIGTLRSQPLKNGPTRAGRTHYFIVGDPSTADIRLAAQYGI